jgi:hypothetical protein
MDAKEIVEELDCRGWWRKGEGGGGGRWAKDPMQH